MHVSSNICSLTLLRCSNSQPVAAGAGKTVVAEARVGFVPRADAEKTQMTASRSSAVHSHSDIHTSSLARAREPSCSRCREGNNKARVCCRGQRVVVGNEGLFFGRPSQ